MNCCKVPTVLEKDDSHRKASEQDTVLQGLSYRGRLDWLILEVFSNLGDSMILSQNGLGWRDLKDHQAPTPILSYEGYPGKYQILPPQGKPLSWGNASFKESKTDLSSEWHFLYNLGNISACAAEQSSGPSAQHTKVLSIKGKGMFKNHKMTVGVWCNVTTVIVTGRASCGSIQTISNYSSKFLISNLQAAAELMAHYVLTCYIPQLFLVQFSSKREDYCEYLHHWRQQLRQQGCKAVGNIGHKPSFGSPKKKHQRLETKREETSQLISNT